MQEVSEYIYKTNDFDAICKRISGLEYKLDNITKELELYKGSNNVNKHKCDECNYRLEKTQKELDFNLKKMNETINTICTNL